MKILKNFSLKSLNTFGIEAKTKYFVILKTKKELFKLFLNKKFRKIPLLILGKGSNILFKKEYFEGLIIKINFKGINIIEQNKKKIIVQVSSGENWNNFVNYTLKKSWSGLENLSMIPGSVGAAPIQNIGAYGVEVKKVIKKIEAYEISTGKIIFFSTKNCKFGYRDSFFKNEGKDRFIILSVNFCLSKQNKVNISYKSLKEELQKTKILQPNIIEISKAVINLRKQKIPDPKIKGNGGSFFKNPIIKKELYKKLKIKYPKIIGHNISKNYIKISAGWLIEKAGWKGKKIGNASVYSLQALILINDGEATGKEIYTLSKLIIKDIYNLFGITLEYEIRIV